VLVDEQLTIEFTAEKNRTHVRFWFLYASACRQACSLHVNFAIYIRFM